MRTLGLGKKIPSSGLNGADWKRKGDVFPGTPSATPLSAEQNTAAIWGRWGWNQASLLPNLTEFHLKSPPLFLSLFFFVHISIIIVTARSSDSVRGLTLSEGRGSDASSIVGALLSYWCSQMKREVSHTVVAGRLIQPDSHLDFLKNIKVARWQS